MNPPPITGAIRAARRAWLAGGLCLLAAGTPVVACELDGAVHADSLWARLTPVAEASLRGVIRLAADAPSAAARSQAPATVAKPAASPASIGAPRASLPASGAASASDPAHGVRFAPRARRAISPEARRDSD